MLCRFLYCAVAWTFVSASLGAQTPLRWKFEPGQTFEFERVFTQKQVVVLKGKSFTSDRQTTWLVRIDVKEKQDDGFRLAATLVKVVQKVNNPSADEEADPNLNQKMQGSAFVLVVTPAGRLTQMQGYEDFLKRLSGDDKGKLKALGGTAYTEDALRDAFADLFGPLPEKEVAKNDAWKGDYVEPIPHFGVLRVSARYVYAGKTEGREQITYALQTRYETPKDDESVLFRIVNGTIHSDKAAGRMAFDSAQGRLVEHDRKMSLRGTLTIEAMEREHPLKFTSENEVKIRMK